MKKILTFVCIYLLAQILWFVPPPTGLLIPAWHLFTLFFALILGVLFRPFPLGAVALIALTAAIATNTLELEDAFRGFSNEIVWLIVLAMFIARGFVTTGLGKRLSYKILGVFGGNSLGIGYGLILTDLLLAPAIPSVTARVGGIIYPILRSIVQLFSRNFHDPKMGAFLTQTVFQGSVITSAMFLTSIAGNPLIAHLSAQNGVFISWITWMVAAIVPGLCSLLIVPYVIYRLFLPETKKTPEAKVIAKKNHIDLGKVTTSEKTMIGTFILLIALWIFGPHYNIGPTETALIGLALLLVTKILDWKDLLSLGNVWDTFIWFSVLITFAGALNSLGFSSFIGTEVAGRVKGLNWVLGLGVLSLLYFYLHYLFVSAIAQIGALYTSFLVLAIGLGSPPLLAALVFAFISSLMACLSHYGAGQAPILFERGKMSVAKWWQTGLIVSIINIFIWFFVGGIWWRFLGYF